MAAASSFVACSRSHLTKSSNMSAKPSKEVPDALQFVWVARRAGVDDPFASRSSVRWQLRQTMANSSTEGVARDVMQLQAQGIVEAAEWTHADLFVPRRSSARCLRRSRFNSSLFMFNPLK